MNRSIKVFIQLARDQDAAKWRERYLRGELSDAVPYGYHHAGRAGFSLAYSVDSSENCFSELARKVATRLLGFDIVHAWKQRDQIRHSDIIWTHTEREYLAAASINQTMNASERPKLLAQSVWLMDRWDQLNSTKRFLYRLLMGTADVLTFHSDINATKARSLRLDSDIRVVPFGISLDSFLAQSICKARQDPETLRVLALGNDIHRDWPTLLSAISSRAEYELSILTAALPAGAPAANVRIGAAASNTEILAAYRWADIVAVPLKKNMHASGVTVALEAIQMGKPVVVTRTGGLDGYFSGADVTFIPEGDIAAWQEVLADIAMRYDYYLQKAAHAQRTVMEKQLTTEGFAARHVEITHELLKKGQI